MRGYIYFLLFLSFGCASHKKFTFTKRTFEQEINLASSNWEGPFLILLTEDKAQIKFKVADVIDLYRERLINSDFQNVRKELERELINLNNIKKDTIFEETKIGFSSLRHNVSSWVGHDLLLKGKAQVKFIDNQVLTKAKYVFVEDLLGGESGSFYDEKKRRFFYHVLLLGE
jgi:hypothetical protein